jgi:hypothetical protein
LVAGLLGFFLSSTAALPPFAGFTVLAAGLAAFAGALFFAVMQFLE